jgi:hypothetical protein
VLIKKQFFLFLEKTVEDVIFYANLQFDFRSNHIQVAYTGLFFN